MATAKEKEKIEKVKERKRQYIGKDIQDVMELPNLIDIQVASYEGFLQRKALLSGEPLKMQGLEDAFRSTFPIKSSNEEMTLEFEHYTLDDESIKFSEMDCKKKGLTYSVSLKARINLIFSATGEIRQKDIYMGDIPLMTERGTFIINGAERVVVSQIHRSPGVIFCHDKSVYSSRIIPYRGSWLEFEIDQKRELIYTKIDRKKRILGTIFLRALGFSSREEIIKSFYSTKTMSIVDSETCREGVAGCVLAAPVWIDSPEPGEDGKPAKKKLYKVGEKMYPHNVDELLASGIKTIEYIDFDAPDSLNSPLLINCFEREEIKFPSE
jgi:DNA-directed RNA polymerase subunit beta